MIHIPESFIEGLNKIPEDKPVAIIMRHAERFEIERGKLGLDVGLTDDGRKSAFKLGEEYLKGKLSEIYSSYVQRCVDTGKYIAKGANADIEIKEWGVLAGYDVFVKDFALMSKFYMTQGMLTLLDLAFENKPVDGLNDISVSVNKFIDLVFDKIEGKNGINLFITHDMFISLIAGEIFRHKTTGENWPSFMEPIFLWKNKDKMYFVFRDYYLEK